MFLVSLNGMSMKTNTASSNQIGSHKDSDIDHDSETTSQISSTLLDVTNLVSLIFYVVNNLFL